MKEKKNEKEYSLITLPVEVLQPTSLECSVHKLVDPSQFKLPFDCNELYQSIKIFWSLGSVELWTIRKKEKEKIRFRFKMFFFKKNWQTKEKKRKRKNISKKKRKEKEINETKWELEE